MLTVRRPPPTTPRNVASRVAAEAQVMPVGRRSEVAGEKSCWVLRATERANVAVGSGRVEVGFRFGRIGKKGAATAWVSTRKLLRCLSLVARRLSLGR